MGRVWSSDGKNGGGESWMKSPKENRDARRKTFRNFVLDFGIYAFCLAGVLITRIIPDFTMVDIQPHLPSIPEFFTAAVVAIIVVLIGERSGDLEGKRTKFGRRAKTAFLLGVFSIEIVSKIPFDSLGG